MTEITTVIIKANPDRGHNARTVTREPRIFRTVSGTGFPADIATLQITTCTPAGTLPAWLTKDIGVQSTLNQECQRSVDDVRCVLLRASLRH